MNYYGPEDETFRVGKKARSRDHRKFRRASRQNRAWKKFGSSQDFSEMTEEEYNYIRERKPKISED